MVQKDFYEKLLVKCNEKVFDVKICFSFGKKIFSASKSISQYA
jgi:hypothetical protein